MLRRPASHLTINYPDGQTVRLVAGQPGATLPNGRTLTLTRHDLSAAACQLVAHGLATITGPAYLTATVPRPELVANLAEPFSQHVPPPKASPTDWRRHVPPCLSPRACEGRDTAASPHSCPEMGAIGPCADP
jgi:hypothetical protein